MTWAGGTNKHVDCAEAYQCDPGRVDRRDRARRVNLDELYSGARDPFTNAVAGDPPAIGITAQ